MIAISFDTRLSEHSDHTYCTYVFGRSQCPSLLAATTPTFVGHDHLGNVPDAAGIDPAVLEPILLRLSTATDDLSVTFFQMRSLISYLVRYLLLL
jgi:hypothetical protein